MSKRAGLLYNTPLLPFPPVVSEDCAAPRTDAVQYQHDNEKDERIAVSYYVDMAAANQPAGPNTAVNPPQPARSFAITPENCQCIPDLLAAIKLTHPDANLPMLQVAAKRVAEFMGVPLERLPVDGLGTIGPDFRLFLQARQYKAKTIRTYVHFVNVLRAQATDLRLLRPDGALAAPWNPVLVAMGKKAGAASIVRYAISHGRTPDKFTLEDLRGWVELMQCQGRTYGYTDNERSRFRRAMARCGFTQNLCEVFQWQGSYTVPWDQMPAEVRAETDALAQWKQARFAPGRRRGCRHRPVSANKLRRFICQLYGFATTVQKQAVGHLAELIAKNRVEAFVAWFLNERQRKTTPLRANLGLLAAAVKQYPALHGNDFSWFEELITTMEEDDAEAEQRQRRKAARALPYDVLTLVPGKIRALREAGGHAPKYAALLVMYELMLRWWLALPWRQRNIRECRIESNPNVFKGELPPSFAIRKPEWVERALQRNPHEQFWLMHFSKSETKTGNEFYAVLPQALVPLLEVYLGAYRKVLVNGNDPGMLFVNQDGEAFTDKRMTMLVENLTFQYAGKAINPHLLRDIFAYKWLDDHPEDYLTLSMILWHRDIKTTLQIYGRNFNESNGIARVDDWLQRREH